MFKCPWKLRGIAVMAQSRLERPEIVRKDPVPEEVRTEERDEAADYIEEMWPAKLSEIAEESGFSVSHVHNTLDKYFTRLDGDESRRSVNGGGGERPKTQAPPADVPVEIPDDIETVRERRAYLRGWANGFLSSEADV